MHSLFMNAPANPSAEELVVSYVLERLPLGIYDPNQPKRPRVPVVSFELEFLEEDVESGLFHAAGPVTLQTAEGETERHLRVSLPITETNGIFSITDESRIRAVYVVLVNEDSGSCKETAALANA